TLPRHRETDPRRCKKPLSIIGLQSAQRHPDDTCRARTRDIGAGLTPARVYGFSACENRK
ncbi:hypothetical protein, partial [Achromobacter xylosoxidans]|uniref:hypothetical protein n=1 Tax=Alcaligenes xylosoxydans xylosoxydans TaxID=85698 RepID=UPI001F1312AA